MFTKTMGAALIIALSALSVHEARAQSDERKFEAGGQFSLLRLPTLTITASGFTCVASPCRVTQSFGESRQNEPGIGGRLGYNFSRHLALEAEGNFFPRNRDLEGGHKVQGLFGAKVGNRFEKIGLFAKARPGFVRLSKGDYEQSSGCIAIFPPPLACFQPVARTNFAFDLGGVAEVYPSKNTLIRFDAGDTIIHFKERNTAAFQVPSGSAGRVPVAVPVFAKTTHNFQASVGVGWRF